MPSGARVENFFLILAKICQCRIEKVWQAKYGIFLIFVLFECKNVYFGLRI